MSEQRMKGQGNSGNNGDYNAWGGSQQVNNQYYSRGNKVGGHNYDNNDSYNNYSKSGGGYDSVRDIERGIQGLNRPSSYNDRNASNNNSHREQQNNSQAQKDAARKMTWASIASQPPKPTVSTTSSLGIKKKPGMPPPPMVPGRHNMDIGTWDSPAKANPPLVPPPIIQTSPPQPPKSDFGSDSHNTGRSNGSSSQNPAWPTPGQATSLEQQAQQQPPQSAQNQQGNGGGYGRDRGYDSYNDRRNNDRGNDMRGGDYKNDRYGPGSGGYHQQNRDGDRPQRERYNNQGPYHSNSMNHNNSGGNYGGPHNNARYPRDDYNSSSNNYNNGRDPMHRNQAPQPQTTTTSTTTPSSTVAPNSDLPAVTLDTLLDMSKYNPANFEIENIHLARFFVIKSYSEDDIHRSIKYNIWCSTEHGNKRLDQAFHEREKENGAIYLFYSVNGSGHFCGMAQMISNVDYSSNSSVWAQNKWKGSFKVRWIYVKDVPNTQLRAIRLENNENKPVTNSRDTQEVPNPKGEQVWRIIHSYKHSTSLFDDFVHYELRQREEDSRRTEPGQGSVGNRSPPPPHQYRSGYQESNNNPRDMGPPSGNNYDRYNQGGENKYNSGGFNGRNNYDRGNSGFERNNYGNYGGYENKSGGNFNNRNNYGYNRRDDQNSSGPERSEGTGGGYSSSGNNYSRGGYRGGNNRGGFNNDYYNNRRQEGRERNYRPQYNSVDPENE